ncbi:MAG: hypothetical protein QSU88_11640, partial [Candidatus Methanoperedens sp.]|nr:hypothetical protein [Candidatus Methanoperedens sp.]
ELAAKTSIKEPDELKNPSAEKALFLSDTYKVPLHPKYTYLWHDISIDEFSLLAEYIRINGKYSDKLTFPNDDKIKTILEVLLVPHIVREKMVFIVN